MRVKSYQHNKVLLLVERLKKVVKNLIIKFDFTTRNLLVRITDKTVPYDMIIHNRSCPHGRFVRK